MDTEALLPAQPADEGGLADLAQRIAGLWFGVRRAAGLANWVSDFELAARALMERLADAGASMAATDWNFAKAGAEATLAVGEFIDCMTRYADAVGEAGGRESQRILLRELIATFPTWATRLLPLLERAFLLDMPPISYSARGEVVEDEQVRRGRRLTAVWVSLIPDSAVAWDARLCCLLWVSDSERRSSYFEESILATSVFMSRIGQLVGLVPYLARFPACTAAANAARAFSALLVPPSFLSESYDHGGAEQLNAWQAAENRAIPKIQAFLDEIPAITDELAAQHDSSGGAARQAAGRTISYHSK